RSAKDRHRPSISRVTSEARPASSSAPSVSAPLSWLRQSNFSASRSNSKRPEKFTEPFGRLRAARGGRLQQSPPAHLSVGITQSLDQRRNRLSRGRADLPERVGSCPAHIIAGTQRLDQRRNRLSRGRADLPERVGGSPANIFGGTQSLDQRRNRLSRGRADLPERIGGSPAHLSVGITQSLD